MAVKAEIAGYAFETSMLGRNSLTSEGELLVFSTALREEGEVKLGSHKN